MFEVDIACAGIVKPGLQAEVFIPVNKHTSLPGAKEDVAISVVAGWDGGSTHDGAGSDCASIDVTVNISGAKCGLEVDVV